MQAYDAVTRSSPQPPSFGLQSDTTFEKHYSVGELAKQWGLSRETVRRLVADERDVVKVRMGLRRAATRYSVPESVARRIHTRLLNPS